MSDEQPNPAVTTNGFLSEIDAKQAAVKSAIERLKAEIDAKQADVKSAIERLEALEPEREQRQTEFQAARTSLAAAVNRLDELLGDLLGIEQILSDYLDAVAHRWGLGKSIF